LQEEKAGAIKETEGDPVGALELYLEAGLATRASRLVKSEDALLSNPDVVDRVSTALLRGEFYEQAGELFEKVGQEDQVPRPAGLKVFQHYITLDKMTDFSSFLLSSLLKLLLCKALNCIG
jgi:hypothetical protein